MFFRSIHQHTSPTTNLGMPDPRPETPQRQTAAMTGMPQSQAAAETVYRGVRQALELAEDRAQNLSAFRPTWREPEFDRLMQDVQRQSRSGETTSLFDRCLTILADLFHAPQNVGMATISRTQAVQLAGLAMLWNWRRLYRQPGRAITQPNLILGPQPAPTWTQFARLFDIETRILPTQDTNGRMDVTAVLDQMNADTIGVVGVLGSATTGCYDSLEELDGTITEHSAKTGRYVPIHVDAHAGFVAPFLTPELRWDFRLASVQSIHVSSGGYGLTHPATEWVLWRDQSVLPKRLCDTPPNLEMAPGEENLVAQYYTLMRLGRNGYTQIMRGLQETAQFISRGLANTGRLEVLSDEQALPVVCVKMRDPQQGDLSDLSAMLQTRGWNVPVITSAADGGELLRISISEGFGRDRSEMLLKDVNRALKELTARPASSQRSELEEEVLKQLNVTLDGMHELKRPAQRTTPVRVR